MTSAGSGRRENLNLIATRSKWKINILHDFESFSFPRHFIYLSEITFSGPYRWNFPRVRDFVYFIDPLCE